MRLPIIARKQPVIVVVQKPRIEVTVARADDDPHFVPRAIPAAPDRVCVCWACSRAVRKVWNETFSYCPVCFYFNDGSYIPEPARSAAKQRHESWVARQRGR
jgi:hypothetical protein